MLGDKKECATEKTVGGIHGVFPPPGAANKELLFGSENLRGKTSAETRHFVGSKFWYPIFSKKTALVFQIGVDVQMSAPLRGTPGIRCRSSLATVPLAVPGFPKCPRLAVQEVGDMTTNEAMNW